MDIVLSMVLVAFACVIAMQGTFFTLAQERKQEMNRVVGLTAVCGFLWCMGYACMGVAENTGVAFLCRAVGLLGVYGFLTIMAYGTGLASGVIIRHKKRWICGCAVVAVPCWAWFAFSGTDLFVQTGYGWAFTAQMSPARGLHMLYISIMIITGTVFMGVWYRKVKLHREKRMVAALLMGGYGVVIGLVFDLLLPVCGVPSFPPLSCLGVFISYTLIAVLIRKNNAFHLSVQNLMKYVYEYAGLPVLAFDEQGQLALANQAARGYFEKEFGQTPGLELNDFFQLTDADCEALSEIKEGQYSFRLFSKIGRRKSAVVFTTIFDKYKQPLCRLCFVHDLSQEMKALQELDKAKENLKQQLAEKSRQMQRLSLQAVTIVANIIDAKDPYTKGHSVRVARYAWVIAKELGWPEDKMTNLRYIAMLHDIGKIGVPDTILNKAGELTPDEYEIVKSHTVLGGEILKDIATVEDVDKGARYHHERYDGKGYPDGLKGEEIPMVARIIGVADAFDTMSSNLVYRKRRSREETWQELRNGRGTQFDPQVVDAFLQVLNRTQWDESVPQEEIGHSVAEEGNRLLARIVSQWEEKNRETGEKDYLTGLWGRREGERQIRLALQETGGCLVVIDMDNLKGVNDRYGHLAGDQALRILGDVLRQYAGEPAITARMGGDEFLCFWPGVMEKEEIRCRMENILSGYDHKKEENEILRNTSLSAGVNLCEIYSDYSDNFRGADKALYHIKRNGKGGYDFYRNALQRYPVSMGTDLAKLTQALLHQGAYQGTLQVEPREFSRMYEYVSSLAVRNKKPLQLIMITLQEKDDKEFDFSEQEQLMTLVERAIRESLRKVDVCTRYSQQQFLVILTNTGEENLERIMERIKDYFYRYSDKNRAVLLCQTTEPLHGEEKTSK